MTTGCNSDGDLSFYHHLFSFSIQWIKVQLDSMVLMFNFYFHKQKIIKNLHSSYVPIENDFSFKQEAFYSHSPHLTINCITSSWLWISIKQPSFSFLPLVSVIWSQMELSQGALQVKCSIQWQDWWLMQAVFFML